jgi:hypothetical protein
MTAAPMTDHDRALWVAAKQDYTHALAIAQAAWQESGKSGVPYDVIQAAAATILIHITKLRSEERLHVKIPAPSAAPAETKAASQSVAVPPPCKKCGGATERAQKRSEKSPDFVCLQQKGDCGKPSKDKTKWFPTGQWAEPLKPNQPNALAGRTDRESFEESPAGLDEDSDSLPF